MKGRTNLELSNFILNIVVQFAKPCPIPSIQLTQLALKNRLIQNLTNSHTSPGSLITIARTNTLTGSTDLTTTQLGLLETIHDRVQLEADVGTVRDEDALSGGGQTLFFQGGQFLEEAGDVHNGSGADKVDTFGGDKARGEDVEVVGHIVVDNRVASVCRGKEKST